MYIKWKPALSVLAGACVALACRDAAHPLLTESVAATATANKANKSNDMPITVQWNAKAIALVEKYLLRAAPTNRVYMLLSVAQANALDASDDDASTDLSHGSTEGLLGGAAVTVLAYVFPAEQASLEDMLASERASAPNSDVFDDGVTRGRAVAQLVVDNAKTDGSTAVVVPIIPVGPGYWTPIGGQVATPQWPFVRPMLMQSGSQFRPAPPPAFGSAVFLAALQRVRKFSDTRTPEQLAILNFWNDPASAGNHAAHWNQIAVSLILRDHLSERATARVLAHLNLALSDAAIACFDAKYTYWYIRPYQADPLITTPIGQPAHPSYPSLHSCQGGAAVGVLEHEFPKDQESLRAMGAEMNLSREFAGLHYWFDTQVGTEMGRSVAALANALPRHAHDDN